MSLNAVNGSLFKKMIMNGAINLKNNHKEVDALNVFPVPDGDTGTNMQMTMMAGVKEMNSCQSSSIIDISKSLSRGLLMGARGNSGVILSQFFRGMYVATKELKDNYLSVDSFINCLYQGYEVAYKAVMEPVEGTILTVVRESIQKVKELKDTIKDIDSLLDCYLEQAKKSLDNTPNLLPVLKDAGVVDSGGAGFVKVVEGMIMAVQGKMLETEDNKTDSAENTNISKYRYCVEYVIELNDKNIFTESDMRSPLSMIGDSLLLVKEDNLCKVHIHTNSPSSVIEIGQKYGEFVDVKVENMRISHTATKIEKASASPKIQEHKKYGLVAVCFGEGIKNTFKELGVDYIIDGGQTMNPPTEEFVKAVKAVNADNIIIIPNNSNVILSAEQATKICNDQNIKVLPAKTVAQGYSSLMGFDAMASLEDNVNEMTSNIKNTNSGEVTYAVRDTEIKGVKIQAGDYMGICNGEIVVSTQDRIDACKELLNKCITDDSAVVTFFYGNNVSKDEVIKLEEYCSEVNEDIEVELIEGNQDIYSYIISVE